MITTLMRKQFVERTIGAEELQGIVLMLTDWARQAGEEGNTALSIQLWGFPRCESERYIGLWREQALAMGLSPDSVTESSPDVLQFESDPVPPTKEIDAPNFGRYLVPLITVPGFENIWCELRIRFGIKGDQQRTVVLYGVVQAQRFILKAIWPEGDGHFGADTHAHGVWPSESKFLISLQEFWNGNRALPAWARTEIFKNQVAQATGNALVWFLQPNTVGLQPFLLRIAAAAAVATFSWIGLMQRFPSRLLRELCMLGLFASSMGLGYHFYTKVKRIYRSQRTMCTNLQRMYSQPIRHPDIDLNVVPGALTDPALIKLSAEITALGGQHFKDVTIDPPVDGAFSIRLYLFEEDATVFYLILMRSTGNLLVFPSKTTFLLRTRLSGNKQLVLTNASGGWRKPLLKHVISRQLTGETDPAIILAKQRELLHKLESEGETRVPIDRDAIIEQMDREHEETAKAMARYGYFRLPDAFRMAFKIVLPDYKA